MATYEDLFIQSQSNALSKDASYYRDLIRILRRQKRMSLISTISNAVMMVAASISMFFVPSSIMPAICSIFGSSMCCACFYFAEFMECGHQMNIYLRIIGILYGDKAEAIKKTNVSYLKPISS